MKNNTIFDARRAVTLAATAAMLTLLTGCALDPVDVKPEQKIPETWSGARKTAEATVSDEWWKAFGDPGLDTVVARALASSPSMDTAFARVRAARAAAGMADSGFWPTLDSSAAYNRNRTTQSTLFPQAGGRTTDNFHVGGTIGYEVDLWGKVRNESKAAKSEYRSSHADLAASRLLVAAETTKIWFDLRQAKAERATLSAEYTSRIESHGLLSAREKAGIIGGDEVARAKLAAAQAKYDLDGTELKISLLRNALAAAVGEIAGTAQLPEPGDELPANVPAVPLTLPSALLKSRPDVASADLRLDAALAREGVARTNFFPNLTLSASGGFSSINAGDLFNKGSRVWSIGPTLSIPIFSGGSGDATLETSRARFDADWAGYRSSVLTAFRETEDALVTIDRLAGQENLVAAVVESADETLTFAKARYDKGLSSNLEVTLAERDTLAARRELIKIRFDRLRASANLARALGGGWNRESAIDKSAIAFEDRLEAADKAAKK
jgi:multidrug efflux system outer membrane protein